MIIIDIAHEMQEKALILAGKAYLGYRSNKETNVDASNIRIRGFVELGDHSRYTIAVSF